MSFLFEHVVSIRRPAHQASGAGKQGYGGIDAAETDLIAEGVPASVQAKGTGRANPAGLPADASPFRWQIVIEAGHVDAGVIQDRDIVIDNLGRRFQVSADYSHSLGWTLQAEKLEL